MDATRRLTLAGILSTVFAGPVASEPESGVVTAEGDFVDIDLPIVDVQRAGRQLGDQSGGGFVGITARGRIEGDTVGLKVDLHPDWKRQPLGGTGAFAYWGKGTCRSIGADSDRFTALLTRLYKLPGAPAPMLDAVEATIVGLANDPARILSAPTKMKFFFHSEIKDRYAEVYINIDVPARRLEFHEKDLDYRVPLVRALCERA